MPSKGRHSRFRFPEEEELERIADSNGISLLDVVKEAIEDYIQKERLINQEIKMKFLAESVHE